ncbi:MAG TPA: HAD family phosphatase [Casimicrobiaceae bacterium]
MKARRPERRPLAVIFDMDGLMLDTERLAPRAWTAAAEAMNIEFDHALIPGMVGRNFRDCRAQLSGHYGSDYPTDALLQAWHVAYEAIIAREGIGVKPGLVAVLDWLDQHAIPRAVATSTRRDRAQAKLAQTGFLSRIDALVGGDEVERGKPEPDIFLLAAARLQTAPDACVVLEDSEPGVRAALAAGMTPIMVPDQQSPSVDLLAREPLILPTLHDVSQLLASLPP